VRTRFDRASIVADCEASLARLGTDRLDVLLLQRPSEQALRAAELVEAAEQLVRDGKVRAWGVTMSAVPELRMAISAGAQVVCLPYNLFHSDALDELVSSIVVAGTGVLARSPLAYGLLAGALMPAQGFVAGDHRSRRWSAETLGERLAAVEAFAFLARGDIESSAEAALRWVLTNELVSSCVVGARTPAQATSAARASSGPPYLRDEDLARVPQVLAALGL
jgi:aryl-alcohol dehydrogenase-like predicted oxidoreductase